MQTQITSDEKKLLVAILAERKARGLPIPADAEIPILFKGDEKWNLDENGYFIKKDGKHFNPRDELVEFINSTARFILLRSGRGGGKSTAGVQKGLLKVKQGLSGAVLAPDFEQFRTSTWQELREWIPWGMVVPKQRYRQMESWEAVRPFAMVFMNGARIYCKGLKDPESARGSNINWLMYDEGRRDPNGLGWKNAIAAVRIGHQPQAWCTTTPANSQHWTSTFFSGEITPELIKILEEVGADRTQELFQIIQTNIERNKQNLDPMFYASIIATYPSGYLRAREVEGRVADEEGSLGDRAWFDGKVYDKTPDWINTQVRFWDLAGTEKKMTPQGKKNDPDETIGSLVGTDVLKEKFCLQDQVGGAWSWDTIKKMVVEVARRDGQEVKVCFEQEPASGGKNQVAELISVIKAELPDYDVTGLEAKKLGDRVLAANTWFGEAAEGQWYMVKGLWNEPFLGQLDYFPNPAIHDDRITSVSGARHKIAPIRKWRKIKFLAIGQEKEEKEQTPEPVVLRFR
jgi:phage terminase large subunit-like protein